MKSLSVVSSILLGLVAAALHYSSVGCAAEGEPSKYVRTVSIVGPVDNRRTFSESGYQEEQIRKRFSGTGELHCGGRVGAANLVLRNGLLALEAHAFFRRDENHNCLGLLSPKDLSACYFNVIDARGNFVRYPYYINPATLKMGGRNPANARVGGSVCKDEHVPGNDWAVVELKDPVPHSVATPYDLFDTTQLGDRSNGFSKLDNLKVAVVAAGAENFDKGLMPTICNGIVGFIGIYADVNGDQHATHTNSCSGGSGTSGAAVAVEQGDHAAALFGIATSFRPDTAEFNYVEYGPKNFSAGPVIEGEFKDAILRCSVSCPTTQ
jgi:hypothetical protein